MMSTTLATLARPRKSVRAPGWHAVRRAAERRQRRLAGEILKAARQGKKTTDFGVLHDTLMNRATSPQAMDIAATRIVERMTPVIAEGIRRGLSDVIKSAGNAEMSFRQRPKFGFRAAAPKSPGPKSMITFNVKNPEVLKWIDTHTAENVTGISEASRLAIKGILADSFNKNVPTARIVRHIRGVIGLTKQQASSVIGLAEDIANNPGGRVYAGGRAIRVPDDPDADWVDKQLEKYADRLLSDRAKTIARTETIAAANEGQRQAWLQAESAGLLRSDEVERVWIVTPDERLCPICEELEGDTADLRGTFSDGLSGPPAHPNCRCAQGIKLRDDELSVEEEDDDLDEIELKSAGGPGSGNFGHSGRPGEVGGSGSGGKDRSVKGTKFSRNQMLDVAQKAGQKAFGSSETGLVFERKGVLFQSTSLNRVTLDEDEVESDSQAKNIDRVGDFEFVFYPSDPNKAAGDFSDESIQENSEKMKDADGNIYLYDAEATAVRVITPKGSRAAGGEGSGNFGHEGRPGEVGGSGPGGDPVKSTKETLDKKTADLAQAGVVLHTDVDAFMSSDKPGGHYNHPGAKSSLQHMMTANQKLLDEGVASGKITAEQRDEFYQAYKNSERAQIQNSDEYYNKSRVAFADSWKSSSQTYGSTNMKEAIRRKFGTENFGIIYNPNNHSIDELSVIHHGALLNRMYEETQSEMDKFFPKGQPGGSTPDSYQMKYREKASKQKDEHGVVIPSWSPDTMKPNWDGKHLTLFRGMRGNKGVAGAIESWSSNRQKAAGFGRVRTQTFTTNQILTFHQSKTWRGEGKVQYHENEFIIIRGIRTGSRRTKK